jgi:hypothetical protein
VGAVDRHPVAEHAARLGPACQPQALARVPGRTTLWGGGSVTRNPAGPTFTSVICAYPRAPGP